VLAENANYYARKACLKVDDYKKKREDKKAKPIYPAFRFGSSANTIFPLEIQMSTSRYASTALFNGTIDAEFNPT